MHLPDIDACVALIERTILYLKIYSLGQRDSAELKALALEAVNPGSIPGTA